VSGTGRFTGNVTAPTFIGNLSGSADLLTPINATTSKSFWNPQSLTYQAFGQSFSNSNISSDTGDLTLWLRPSIYNSGSTELCMMIDGDYYSGIGQYKVLNTGNFTNLNQLPTRNFSDLQNKPTTLSGYGITDAANIDHTHSNYLLGNYKSYGSVIGDDGTDG
jgi:hypothetical protein